MQLADLPTRRTEDWKYSDLRLALRETALPVADAPPPTTARRLLDGPIDRLALAQGAHAVTDVRAGAEVLVERMDREGLDARVREIVVGPGASVTRIVVQTGAGVALSSAYVSVAAGGSFRQVAVALGGALARIETHVVVEGAGAAIELSGLYMCGAGRHADLTSVIEHRAVGGVTRQLVKGCVGAGGRGVFQGRIIVAAGAQRTDARQHHHALLLEEGAEAFAKPELVINADDVQCAHGNTVGALDEEALFYMRARGLPALQARALLIEAFLLGALPGDLPAGVEAELAGCVRTWLEARRA
jgi:Fe-S cluster assembly protein SufD